MEENKKRMVETLIRGRNSTRKLQNLFLGKVKDDGSVSVDDLMMEMLGSFYGSLSLFSSCNSNSFSTSVPLSSPILNLASFSHQPPEVCNGKKPARAPAPAVTKKGRGCYKRRSMDPRTKVSDTIEDGYTWRKYGQKDILHSKFPRCYYRCTYKIDHGCKALKQVQKIEDEESNMFHITYFGYHTCPPTSQTFSHPELVIDFKAFKNHQYSSSNPSTSKNIHFDPSFERKNGINVFDKVTSANPSSPVAFGSNDTFVYDMDACHEFASIMGFDNGGTSCGSKSSWEDKKVDLFKNKDILNDIFFDETIFSELFDG